MKVVDTGRLACLILSTALVVQVSGCQKPANNSQQAQQQAPPAQQQQQQLPEGHPPMGGGGPMSGGSMSGGGMRDAEGPTDGEAVALKLTGMSSAEELKREKARLNDASLQPSFDAAYRMTFSAKMAQRNYPDALKLAEQIITAHPDFAPAYRVLGYAKFNTGDPSGAVEAYRKAVQIDPNYGEAEYALAFMYAMSDQTEGLIHYKRSMELGVKDERNIGVQFYGLPKTN